jgi:hypothetical protein
VIASALKTLVPLIIFIGGVIVLFALGWKAKWFVFLATLVLTLLLFASPLGAAIGDWLSGVLFAMTGHHVHL